jgi:hypothetical protein
MHDLESFFWVLFWICIHCKGPGEGRVVAEFDKSDDADTKELVKLNKGQVSDEENFVSEAGKSFMQYYQTMVPWVNRLRRVVFPNGSRRESVDSGLNMWMREFLRRSAKQSRIYTLALQDTGQSRRCQPGD